MSFDFKGLIAKNMEGRNHSMLFKTMSQHPLFFQRTEKTTKSFKQDNRPPDQYSNPEPTKYKAGLMPNKPLRYIGKRLTI